LKLKTCYYCGTKYNAEEVCCPLCGQTEVEQEALDEVPAKVAAVPDVDDDADFPEETVRRPSRSRRRQQNIASTVVCIILALIVVAGIVFILHSLGVFRPSEPKEPTSEQGGNLDVPVDPVDPNTPVACESIAVLPTSVSLNAIGQQVRLDVSLQPEACTEQVVFASDNEAVATVSDNGVLLSVGEGTAVITVTCGTQSATVEVVCDFSGSEPPAPSVPEVPDADLSKAYLNLTDFTMFTAGEVVRLRVKGLPEGAAVSVEWSIDDSAVATIEDGRVVAVASGTTKVHALLNGEKKLSCIVRCSKKVSEEPVDTDSPKLSHTDVTLRKFGETFVISLSKDSVKYAGVTWTSEDPSICTVDASGVVSAVSSGTTKVVGTYEEKTYSCIIRCHLPEVTEDNPPSSV